MNKEKQTRTNKYFKRFFWAVFLFYLLNFDQDRSEDTDLSAVPKFLTGEKKGFQLIQSDSFSDLS